MVIAATGFFDGVHIGHKAVLSVLSMQAEREGAQSMVITFWPHPRAVLQSGAVHFRLLNSLEEKKELVIGLGIDHIHLLPFTREFSQMSAKMFFIDILKAHYGVTKLVVGHNHRIGHDDSCLETVAQETGIDLVRVDKTLCGEETVSSTKIREAIHTGMMEQANLWLGYPYALHGVVVEGNRIGRTMGFPTANLQLYEPLKQLPADGVYAVEVALMDKRYKGMMNIGFRPTIPDARGRIIETNIFDFDDDIYGLPMSVYPLHRLRGEQGFSSMEALKEQLRVDREVCASWFLNRQTKIK
ncbi:MAG: riboflavin biosynthesis protein RibF [Bacteroidales bacterium]|nr:riboflavin biosynthesis protein RibF [Bacteroidales bacterium]